MASPKANSERAAAEVEVSNNEDANGKVTCLYDNFKCFRHLYSVIRDRESNRLAFVRAATKIMSILCEEALCLVDQKPREVITPTGSLIQGVFRDLSNIVAVSIIRAGDSMLDTFLATAPEAVVGKILIQRNEETAEPNLYYSKLPDMTGKKVFLLDPMLATGGSAICAVKCIVERGGDPKDIIFVNVVACPEGVRNMQQAYPSISIVTGCIDQELNDKKYIIPGLGDFGDRFFGTV